MIRTPKPPPKITHKIPTHQIHRLHLRDLNAACDIGGAGASGGGWASIVIALWAE